MPYEANKHELELIEQWKQDKIFERTIDERPEDKPFAFYDGPPFATGIPHYGHMLSSTIKDVIPRYKTMRGFRVRRRWGWDCHGLPIEQLIEKQLEISGKQEIEEKLGVEKFNEACRSKVLEYAGQWKEMVERMARWIEFDNAYKTMDSTYMESVWWALKTIWDKGRIYEGWKVLQYCPRCETPISKAETAMDHSYKDVTEESVTVAFKLVDPETKGLPDDTYILAWTTTPWTLPGNLGLAVGPEIAYNVVAHGGKNYIVAKDRVETVFAGLDYEVVQELVGSELAGCSYEPLFDVPDMLEGKTAYIVMAADFVTTAEGTGIVHTAVMYGEDDFELGKKHDLPQVAMLDAAGHYNDVAPKLIQGQFYKKTEKAIKDDLESRELLFKREQTTHSYPHCWRCGNALIYNAISAWFIDIQGEIKKRMLELNENITWAPEHLKHGRFKNILETAPDWNISRNRYWATALPFWKCDSKEQDTKDKEQVCDNVVCIGSLAELKEKAVNYDEVYSSDNIEEVDLHKHNVDRVKLACDCGGEMTRIPEVIDCWVESGSMPYAEFHYPFENKDVFEARFPGQFIAEYIAQTRAWFYYMHVLSVLLFDSNSFENVVCTGTLLNDKGDKLSKSKQNFTDPWVNIEKYGMDAIRYYLMTSVVMQAENYNFSDRELRDVYNKVVNITWNVVSFYEMYKEDQNGAVSCQLSEHVLDKWILAKLQLLVQEVTRQYEHYDVVRAGRPQKVFIDELSTWYLRRSRDRFKNGSEEDKQYALATLQHVLQTLAKVMAPMTPFIAEKMYKAAGGGLDSVHLELWPEVDESLQSLQTLEDMQSLREATTLGNKIRKQEKINTRQPLSEIQVLMNHLGSDEELRKLEELLGEELNIKKVQIERFEGDKKTLDLYKQKFESGSWVIEDGGTCVVALNTEITPELKKEGLLREVVRAVNGMRKEQGLTREHAIVISYSTDDEMLGAVFSEYADELKRLTLATEIKDGGKTEVEIGEAKLKLSVA